MTASERPLCDCHEPCGSYAKGYAAGKDKAYFEVLARPPQFRQAPGPLACQEESPMAAAHGRT